MIMITVRPFMRLVRTIMEKKLKDVLMKIEGGITPIYAAIMSDKKITELLVKRGCRRCVCLRREVSETIEKQKAKMYRM